MGGDEDKVRSELATGYCTQNSISRRNKDYTPLSGSRCVSGDDNGTTVCERRSGARQHSRGDPSQIETLKEFFSERIGATTNEGHGTGGNSSKITKVNVENVSRCEGRSGGIWEARCIYRNTLQTT